jgi:dTDP-4-dehydrorhamnose reductase
LPHRVIITGAGGQLGWELQQTAPAPDACMALPRSALDIADADAVEALFARERPALLINAAAYTAVDRAESEPALAMRVNGEGPATLAAACRRHGARLLHVSTDFVFDGHASVPYTPDARPAPLGEYGRSKLAGERAVLATAPGAVVVRTGWVYSSAGHNFVKTMLRLMDERDTLSVVVDQVGTPTWARGLARLLWQAAGRDDRSGIYHWSDAGVCSWYDFAVAIAEEALALGLLSRLPEIHPIPGVEYPTPAKRPAFSVLDKRSSWEDFDTEGIHWRVQLRQMLQELKES